MSIDEQTLEKYLLFTIPPSSLFPDDPTSLLSQLTQEAADLSPEMLAATLSFVRDLRTLIQPSH